MQQLVNDKIIMLSPKGKQIWCYGEIEWDSNFSIACENENDDFIVPGFELSVHSWKEVLENLIKDGHDLEQIEQIETC